MARTRSQPGSVRQRLGPWRGRRQQRRLACARKLLEYGLHTASEALSALWQQRARVGMSPRRSLRRHPWPADRVRADARAADNSRRAARGRSANQGWRQNKFENVRCARAVVISANDDSRVLLCTYRRVLVGKLMTFSILVLHLGRSFLSKNADILCGLGNCERIVEYCDILFKSVVLACKGPH